MKSVQVQAFGEPANVLEVVDREPSVPAAGQVRVRMLAAPINPSDLMTIRGTYTKIPSLPFIPGYEGVGVVESSGPGLFGRALLGRRVALLTADGGSWQEFNVVPARQAVPISEQIPVDQAAMFFVNPTTAYVLTREILRVPSGEWLLQTAAGSALGRMIVRLGDRFGFRTICVVRRSEQARQLADLGTDEVIATDEQNLKERVSQITGGVGVRYAVDCVSGDIGSQVVQCLAPGGRLIVFGTMSGQPLSFSSRDLMTPSSRIEGFWLGNYMNSLSLLGKMNTVYKVGRLIREGVLVSDVGKTFGISDIAAAVTQAETPARDGKVVLQMGTP